MLDPIKINQCLIFQADLRDFKNLSCDLIGRDLERYESLKNNKLKELFKKYRYILYKVLSDLSNRKIDIRDIETTKYGKPYLSDKSQYFFNISHCNNFMVISAARKKVGIDIEEIRPLKNALSMYRDVLSKKELIELNENPDKASQFIKIWTLKEATAKLIGKGLSIDLRTIDTIDLVKKDLNMEPNLYKKNYSVFSRRTHNYYLSTITSQSNSEFTRYQLDPQKNGCIKYTLIE